MTPDDLCSPHKTIARGWFVRCLQREAVYLNTIEVCNVLKQIVLTARGPPDQYTTYENTYKCGELKLLFSPSAEG